MKKDWVYNEIYGVTEHDGWRTISDDIGEIAQKWFLNTIGRVPKENELNSLFKEQPGLMLLLRRVWDTEYNKRINKKIKKGLIK